VLEERGLVARSPNAQDGRSHHLELTASGRQMFEEIMPMALDMQTRLFACLTARETELLKMTLGKLDRQAGVMQGETE